MSKSPITIDPADIGESADWLHNPHVGEMLWSEFMEPLSVGAEELAKRLDTSSAKLRAVITGTARLDADLDLRLARYFRMSPGFYLGLQADHELLEARRALSGALDRIVPRAA